jgi:Co/Zn/Cd efflux system component
VKKCGDNLIDQELDSDYALKKKRTLKFNFWIIFSTWVPFVFIAIFSNSLTLIAQMMMGGAQSLSVFLSWMSTRKSYRLQKTLPKGECFNARFMAFVFLGSSIAVLSMAMDRFLNPREMKEEVALFALVVNSFAVIVNYIQWRKNYRLSKKNLSLVMESQTYLFFIKFFTVLTVEISLSLYFLLQGRGVHDYIDTTFSVALAFLTMYSAYRLFKKSRQIVL